MGHASGKEPQSLHLLGLAHLLFQGLTLALLFQQDLVDPGQFLVLLCLGLEAGAQFSGHVVEGAREDLELPDRADGSRGKPPALDPSWKVAGGGDQSGDRLGDPGAEKPDRDHGDERKAQRGDEALGEIGADAVLDGCQVGLQDQRQAGVWREGLDPHQGGGTQLAKAIWRVPMDPVGTLLEAVRRGVAAEVEAAEGWPIGGGADQDPGLSVQQGDRLERARRRSAQPSGQVSQAKGPQDPTLPGLLAGEKEEGVGPRARSPRRPQEPGEFGTALGQQPCQVDVHLNRPSPVGDRKEGDQLPRRLLPEEPLDVRQGPLQDGGGRLNFAGVSGGAGGQRVQGLLSGVQPVLQAAGDAHRAHLLEVGGLPSGLAPGTLVLGGQQKQDRHQDGHHGEVQDHARQGDGEDFARASGPSVQRQEAGQQRGQGRILHAVDQVLHGQQAGASRAEVHGPRGQREEQGGPHSAPEQRVQQDDWNRAAPSQGGDECDFQGQQEHAPWMVPHGHGRQGPHCRRGGADPGAEEGSRQKRADGAEDQIQAEEQLDRVAVAQPGQQHQAQHQRTAVPRMRPSQGQPLGRDLDGLAGGVGVGGFHRLPFVPGQRAFCPHSSWTSAGNLGRGIQADRKSLGDATRI